MCLGVKAIHVSDWLLTSNPTCLLNFGAQLEVTEEIQKSRETKSPGAVFGGMAIRNFNFAGFFCGRADYSRSWN